jgi:hypothetical protein
MVLSERLLASLHYLHLVEKKALSPLQGKVETQVLLAKQLVTDLNKVLYAFSLRDPLLEVVLEG